MGILGMGRVLTLLIGFGTAICGGSAIAAASPILEAKEEKLLFRLQLFSSLIFVKVSFPFSWTSYADVGRDFWNLGRNSYQ